MIYPGPMCGDRFEFELEHKDTPSKERPDWPLPSFDARDWAEHFRGTAIKLGYSDMDEGWLQTWFANALMRGYDEGRMHESQRNKLAERWENIVWKLQRLYRRTIKRKSNLVVSSNRSL